MSVAARLLAPFRQLVAALGDPQRANRTALALIGGYVLVWWLYGVVAKASQDIHFDMGEAVSWSLVPAYGYAKHPPFSAWVVSVWFAIFPYADWAFYLLSAVSIGVALWFIWLIAARFVQGDRRALALVMLTLSPGFNLQPLKYNPNSVLIPVWAATAYFFLRSFAERSLLMGAIAGLCAAIAMLTKYWSIFLILGFVVAALAHPSRLDYLRSPAPYAAVLVGALALAPNIVSLVDYDFQPFHYAAAAHAVADLRGLLDSFRDYFGGLVFLAGSLALILIACRPGAGALRDMMLPREADQRLMAIATWVAFFAPLLVAVALRTQLATLWTLPMWAMLPATLLSAPRLQVTRTAAAGALALAILVPIAALLASPAIAYAIHRQGLQNHAAHYRLIAAAVEREWNARASTPLKLFGSDTNIVNGAGFYLGGKPLRFDIVGPYDTPWVDKARIDRDGIALACASADAICMQALSSYAGPLVPRREVTLARDFLGVPGAAERYTIAIVPPQQ
ncbi:MAG: glycosyltransferase family 39 protein [Alphaproteobacteria bacterium]|nr:glycosyltransferase family 39 protein [Alphaproteobacteria bacterium]